MLSADNSSNSVFQIPGSIVMVKIVKGHLKLEPLGPRSVEDIGASLVLRPVTMFGKKRKHTVPVKSSGKKKTKIRLPGKVVPTAPLRVG